MRVLIKKHASDKHMLEMWFNVFGVYHLETLIHKDYMEEMGDASEFMKQNGYVYIEMDMSDNQ